MFLYRNTLNCSFPQIWKLLPNHYKTDTCVFVHLVNDKYPSNFLVPKQFLQLVNDKFSHSFCTPSMHVIITLNLTLGLLFCMDSCMLNVSVSSTQAIFCIHNPYAYFPRYMFMSKPLQNML
jgi:hypothetical protein